MITKNPIYLNDWLSNPWNDKVGLEQLMADFAITEKELEGVNIVLASYSCANYSGDAFILYENEGNYFEVNGSHCSCYGLEGQWEPEEAMLAELWHRATVGSLGKDNYADNEFNAELIAVLKELMASE